MSDDQIKPGEQLTLAQINRLRKRAQSAPEADKVKPEAGETDPQKMTVAELKDWLTEQGIEFDASAKKADLQALIPETKPEAGETD
ncbi:MAG TPA: hypothetical protein DHV63_07830, partial [Pseudomonas sp.]|nr:hypothetical protein [Pseudomonas sp.]